MSQRKSIIGGNMEGFFKNFNPDQDSASYEKISSKQFAGRFPGGADAKESQMSIDKVGLGLTFEYLRWWYDNYKTDENGNSSVTDEDIQKDIDTDSQATESYLLKLVDFSQQFPTFECIYNLNIFSHKKYGQSAIDLQISNIQYLIDNGVKIKGIVAGNELYFVVNDFATYQDLFEPLYNACKINFPNIPFGLCVSPDSIPNNSWNNAVFSYISTHNDSKWAVDTHLYYNSKKLTSSTNLFKQLLPSGQILFSQSDQKDVNLDAIYDQFVVDFKNAINFHTEYANYLSSHLPDSIEIWMSEFGCIPAEYWSNTFAQGACLFESLVKNAKSFDYYLMQNLQGAWLWGALSKADKKLDLNPDNKANLERVGIWALQLYQEMENPIFMDYSNGEYNFTFDNPGVYYLAYANIPNPRITSFVLPGLEKFKTKSILNRFVIGANLYSSSGKTGFYTKESIATYDVKGINENNVLFPIDTAFGYIRIELEAIEPENKKPVAVIGALSPSYQIGDNGTAEVTFDGSASYDEDGSISKYNWYDSTGLIGNSSSIKKTYFIPGSYSVSLEVIDDKGLVSDRISTSVIIEAKPIVNKQPIANAGQDETVQLKNGFVNVELSGIESYDPDGTIKWYSWLNTKSGQRVYGVNPTVTLYNPGEYIFELIVTDDKGLQSEVDTVKITVTSESTECDKCKNWWYYIFHMKKCKNCK